MSFPQALLGVVESEAVQLWEEALLEAAQLLGAVETLFLPKCLWAHSQQA